MSAVAWIGIAAAIVAVLGMLALWLVRGVRRQEEEAHPDPAGVNKWDDEFESREPLTADYGKARAQAGFSPEPPRHMFQSKSSAAPGNVDWHSKSTGGQR